MDLNIDAHCEYVSRLRQIYVQNFDSKEPLSQSEIEFAEEVAEHFARNFKALKEISHEDYFEINHGIVCAICYFSFMRRRKFDVDSNFLKSKQILGLQDNFAHLVLLTHHIDKLWPKIRLDELPKFKLYVQSVHQKLAAYVDSAGPLQHFNRWNLIKHIKDDLFALSMTGIMYLACRAAFHLRFLSVGMTLRRHLCTTPSIEAKEVEDLRAWAIDQDTYFSIRKFRMRMINILWTFLNDEPSRWHYSYTRNGEEPTVLAHVTGIYPSTWISGVQHELLYGKAPELLDSTNKLLVDSVLLALFEAHFKTHYNIAWTRYCLCIEDDILEAYKRLLTVEHPMILKVYGHFYVLWKEKLWLCGRFDRAMVLWLKTLRDECNSTIFKNINCINTINRVLPPEAEPEAQQEGIYEVYL